ncbi:hypothetical protein KEM56_001824 [Ascosphaera pollenicola]|nr:hypothetical protein KEM56_001824 [Ascosphaera pollenicola]
MFSEYASRFLAQSQSRITLSPESAQANNSDRHARWAQSSRVPAYKSRLNRPRGNPYQQSTSSQLAYFPFASRATYAPLFYSANDEINEEDDELEEHAKEVADFYALQRSRKQFGVNSRLKDSSDLDEDEDGNSADAAASATAADAAVTTSPQDDAQSGSSSLPDVSSNHPLNPSQSDRATPFSEKAIRGKPNASSSEHPTSGVKSSLHADHMVDIRLEDTLDGQHDSRVVSDPPIKQFQNPFAQKQPENRHSRFHPPLSEDTGSEPLSFAHRDSAFAYDNAHLTEYADGAEPQAHYDVFWGHIFLLSLGGLLASAILVFLHTSPPAKPGIGDTIYSTLHASYHLLGIYTVVSIMVSLLWLALMRAYIRFIVYGMLIAVPIILYSFSIYSFASSFKGGAHGTSVQDKVMRWSSLVPAIVASLWAYTVVKTRHATGRAISILNFACRILAANPALLPLGFATLAATILWTWIWMLMFTRIFLGGHFSMVSHVFIIDLGTWWLGVYFVLAHLWCLGVISGIQRAVTAATVSQWYFHRLIAPSPSSWQIVQAALSHSLGMLFGTICLSSLLSLLIRLPLLILPRRCASILSLAVYSCIPTPVATLTNPLAITHASVHSLPLMISARSLSQLTFLTPEGAAAAPHYRHAFVYASDGSNGLAPYRMAKLFLHANRLVMSLSLGFGGWVISARSLQISGDGGSIRGSMYAYVVGLVAAAIGWGLLGAIEGILAVIVDAAIICWASEVGIEGREARYCREAGELFGTGQDEPLMQKHDLGEGGQESSSWRAF